MVLATYLLEPFRDRLTTFISAPLLLVAESNQRYDLQLAQLDTKKQCKELFIEVLHCKFIVKK